MTLGALNGILEFLLIVALPLSPVALIRFLRSWMDRDRKQIYIWACVLLAIALCLYFNLYLYLI